MMLWRLLFLVLLLIPSQAQAFTRGQWTAYGTGNHASAVWRVTAGNAVAPYDKLLDGTVLHPAFDGLSIGKARGQSGGDDSPFITWDTAVWDSTRKRLVMLLPGGDQGESTDEVNEWDWATGTWNPNGRPVNPSTRLMAKNQVDWPSAYAPFNLAANFGGPAAVRDLNSDYTSTEVASHQNGMLLRPMGRHTYGGVAYMPTVQKYWFYGGFADWKSGTRPFIMGEYSPATKTYEMLDDNDTREFSGGIFTNNSGGLPSAIWDSVSNRVLLLDGDGLWAYNPSAAYGSRVSLLLTDSMQASGFACQMIFDPKRNCAICFGGNGGWVKYDFSGGHTTSPIKTSITSQLTGAIPALSEGTAGFYDPVGDVYVVWNGGTTIYTMNPDTKVFASFTPSGGANPSSTTIANFGAAGSHQVWHRMWYVAGDDVYATVNSSSDAGVFVFAPIRPGNPKLLFSDLAQGPRSGNSDTSKGQTLNQDGALVTVWGENLGTSQGSSTITVGGVAPLVYSWGNATPPACGPAQLFNQFQHLGCVIFQVNHLTPSGAQNIVVTVNGVVSNVLPFTVTTSGNMYFATTAGSDSTGNGTFQLPYRSVSTVIGQLTSGDIGYVGDGVNATTGVIVPATSICPTGCTNGPMAIVTYPGASSQVGDATHDAFVINFSGSGNSMVYSKFSVFNQCCEGQIAIRPGHNSRVVGQKVQAPLGNGSTGAVLLSSGNNVFILGNEFTNVGDPLNFNDLYHTLYIAGKRGDASPVTESNRDIGWNYFHDNVAARAINIYNGEALSAPITLHKVHDNVVLNQQMDGVLLSRGVVGENWVWNNLLINTGLGPNVNSDAHVAIQLLASDPPAITSGLPVLLHVFNNTILNAGFSSVSTKGAFYFNYTGTLDMHNNIVYQTTGLPYMATGSSDPTAGQSSNNLWFGAGVAPGFDANSQNSDPKITSSVSLYDLHLTAASTAAITQGLNKSSLGVASLDFDGMTRPTISAWDIGAYQFQSSATTPAIPTNLTGHAKLSGKGNLK